MALIAHQAGVDGPHGPLLLPTSLAARKGEVTLVAGDPGPALTTLALALGGRVPLDHGEITCNGDPSGHVRRERVVLVDVPGVTEPEPSLPLHVVVGEELALAGLPARRQDIHRFLAAHDAVERSRDRWETLDPSEHIHWLAQIAVERAGATAVVLTSPDRWGGDPRGWHVVARELAERDLVVVVLATHNSLRLLGAQTDYEVGVIA
ncbi:hypothetical protein [Arsenicicoccus sp. oral taxon 190]|uniref:hypothetical protein n=1 Tax=Arsenicicoccus sp. oral taxon 190 TaxID=1658671 RepID=UPI00067A2A5C|nr:hypothetical protein [Arsenicicoccus sp. oral taxon 190]AKT52318.1 hypothetical protein ADJ73_15415 [Arsenicicoccus sp. oral taxon 190]